jgi:3-oxoacyl-[acyl-carrier-protein] synthase-3
LTRFLVVLGIIASKSVNLKIEFMSKISAAITAVGGYVPDYVLTNQILETMVDTNDEWITTRTGIKERRILKGPNKGTSFLAIQAAKNLIQKTI